MLIDKSIGKWCEGTTQLDDFAYQLYVEYIQSFGDKYLENITTQLALYSIYHHNDGNDFLNSFYENAKLILRREKIEKILSRDNR